MTTNENQTRTSRIPAKDFSQTKQVATGPAQDIVELILRDHVPIKALLKTLKDGDRPRTEKEPLFENFVPALTGHARAEEETLYVAMKDQRKLRVDGFEGDTEHAATEQLVHEINSCADDDEWTAKVKVLAEMVEHHLEKEESKMLIDVRTAIPENVRRSLGADYTRLKADFDSLVTRSPIRQKKISEHAALN